jgi:GTPase Era involved in 16S rRNA processing
MPFFIPFLIIGALIGGAAVIASAGDNDDVLPEDWIAFVGPTCSGKSRLANDILGRQVFTVGAEHGTTTEVNPIPYKDGWSLVDTPGVLDGAELAEIAAKTARRSRMIVVCLDGEMYRQTFEWLDEVLQSIRHGKLVAVVLCLTKSDLRLNSQIEELRSRVKGRNIRITDLQEGSVGRRDDVIAAIEGNRAFLTD